MICAINNPQAIKLLFQTLSKYCKVQRKLLEHIPKLTIFLVSRLTNTQACTHVHTGTDAHIPHKNTQIQIVNAHTPWAHKCMYIYTYMPYTGTHTHYRFAQYMVYMSYM